MVMGTTEHLRVNAALSLLAATLFVPSVRAEDPLLQVPKPAPGSRNALATAFTKATPVSIADLKVIEQHVKAVIRQTSPSVVAVEVGYASGSGVVYCPESPGKYEPEAGSASLRVMSSAFAIDGLLNRL